MLMRNTRLIKAPINKTKGMFSLSNENYLFPANFALLYIQILRFPRVLVVDWFSLIYLHVPLWKKTSLQLKFVVNLICL